MTMVLVSPYAEDDLTNVTRHLKGSLTQIRQGAGPLIRRRKIVQLVALSVVVSIPLLGMSGVASAKPKNNPVGSAAWCLHHKKKALITPGCPTYVPPVSPPGTPSLTIAPNALVETGQSEVHAVVQFEDLAGAHQTVSIDSSQLTAACGGTITFSDLQGVSATGAPGSTLTPATFTNQVKLVLDTEGNASVIVSGTDCAPGTDVFEASLIAVPFTTVLATLTVSPPVPTPAGVTASPATEVETGNTPLSGDSNVYAVFYVETDPVYAEQQAEISDIQLEASCQGGWIWEPGNTTLAGGSSSGNISGNPHNTNTGPGDLTTTSGHEPFTTIDDDGNAVFVFMGISCAASSGGSTAIADVAFNIPGSHPTYTGTFVVKPPQVT
jgi:hypothetical protein